MWGVLYVEQREGRGRKEVSEGRKLRGVEEMKADKG